MSAAITAGRPSRREWLLGGALALTAGVAYARMPREKLRLIGKGALDRAVPRTVGGWQFREASGLVLPPPDQLAQLIYDEQLTRTYDSDVDLPVMLLIAYGSSQSGMLQIHRPETCYPASGFRLTDTVETTMPLDRGHGIPVRRFSATSDTRVEQVLYWTRIGRELPVSWAEQRLAVVRSNLRGYVPDGLLVRLSTATSDTNGGQRTLQRFAAALLGAMGPARQMLVADA